MSERIISWVEAEMIEMQGGIAPVDEDTLAQLEANGRAQLEAKRVGKATESKRVRKEEVIYVVRRTGGHKSPRTGKR